MGQKHKKVGVSLKKNSRKMRASDFLHNIDCKNPAVLEKSFGPILRYGQKHKMGVFPKISYTFPPQNAIFEIWLYELTNSLFFAIEPQLRS